MLVHIPNKFIGPPGYVSMSSLYHLGSSWEASVNLFLLEWDSKCDMKTKMLLKEGTNVRSTVNFIFCEQHVRVILISTWLYLKIVFQDDWDNNWEQRVRPKVAWFKVEMLSGMFSSLFLDTSDFSHVGLSVWLYEHSTPYVCDCVSFMSLLELFA